jgi:hypothetical protein
MKYIDLLWMDNREVGVRGPVDSIVFTSTCCEDRLWGPPKLLYNGRGREPEHSASTSAEVKKMWIYATTPAYAA